MIFKLLFFTILLVKCLDSFYIFDHWDALAHHMVLGRFILEHGFYYAHFKFYLSSLLGLFDYFYVIPQWFFGGGIKGQMANQFSHFLFGSVSAITWLWFSIKDKKLFYMAGICILTLAHSSDFLMYGKNDGVLASLVLLTTLLIFNKIRLTAFLQKNRYLLIGVLLGLLPSIKLLGLIYSGILFLTFLYIERPSINSLLKVIFPALCFSSIIFIRNWIVISNPLYPAFLDFFPTDITQEMKDFTNSLNNSHANNISDILKNYLTPFYLKAVGYMALPIAYFNFKRKNHSLILILPIIIAYTTLYNLISSGYAPHRFFFGCYFILIFYIFHSLEGMSLNRKLTWLLLIVIMADSKIDQRIIRTFNFHKDLYTLGVSKKLLYKYYPYAKIWEYVEKDETVLSAMMPMSYYAPRGARLYQAGHSYEGSFFYNCKIENAMKYKQFDKAFIYKNQDNACIKVIRANEKLIGDVAGVEVYSINKLTSNTMLTK